MRLTNAQFLDFACQWAYDHTTKRIDYGAFLSELKDWGVSENDFHQLKEELQSKGVIHDGPIAASVREFELDLNQFRIYLLQVLPSDKLTMARTLQTSGRGDLNTAMLVEQLGVSEKEAAYYLEALQLQDTA